MNIKIKIVSALFILGLLYGCSAEENLIDLPSTSTSSSEQEQAQVILSISVPEASLPLSSNTRTAIPNITDDKALANIAIWAFDETGFLYAITSDQKDKNGNSLLVQRESESMNADGTVTKKTNIYVLLPRSEKKVTLALIANAPDIKQPAVGTSIASAKEAMTFNFNNLKVIPMYGESEAFVVQEGAKPGNIRLKRALAKIEIDAENAQLLDDKGNITGFKLEEVTIVNVNTQGRIVASNTIVNAKSRDNYALSSGIQNNKCVLYIPEALMTDPKNQESRVSVIMKGINYKEDGTPRSRYYRLDFIKRGIEKKDDVHQTGDPYIDYEYITAIERNKHYAFKIESLAPATGSETFDEAVRKEKADNAINTEGKCITIDNEEIRDITTDNEFYLGITQSDLTAMTIANKDRYVVHLSVITNNSNGWIIKDKDLPAGVEVSKHSGPGGNTIVSSLWVYIDASTANINETRTIYIYSGNIRKKVTITIVESISNEK